MPSPPVLPCRVQPVAYSDETGIILLDCLLPEERDAWLTQLRHVGSAMRVKAAHEEGVLRTTTGRAMPVLAQQLVLTRPSASAAIGMHLVTKGGKEVVADVEPGLAAERAGVRTGDVILAVGRTAALSVEQV